MIFSIQRSIVKQSLGLFRFLVILNLLIGLSHTLYGFEYIDHPDNPVFNGALSWDNLAVIAPVIQVEDQVFKMWFAGRNIGLPIQIGYATSNDGIHWAENPEAVLTVGPSGTFDAAALQKFSIVHDDTGYKMWYTGVDQAGLNQIGLAVSQDGISWTKYDQNPVFTVGEAGTWNESSSRAPTVILVDGVYQVWFTGSNEVFEGGIGLAYSNDGINWQEDENNPVMENAPGNVWEAESSTLPCVIAREDGSYLMSYMGYDGFFRQVGLAYSIDGILWNRHPGNPLIGHGGVGTWNAEVSTGPSVVILGPGHYGLWYAGNSNYATSTTWSIGRGNLYFEQLGDLNYDYQANISDIIQMVNIILGFQASSDYQLVVGDLNLDNQITIGDMVLLVDMILE